MKPHYPKLSLDEYDVFTQIEQIADLELVFTGQEVEHADQTHCMHPSVSSPAFVFAQNRANVSIHIRTKLCGCSVAQEMTCGGEDCSTNIYGHY